MSFSHREENRDGRIVDVLTNDGAGIRLAVSRLGAELVSLARRDEQANWTGFLYRDGDLSAPAKGWANHATVMGYFLHRLKDQRSRYRGELVEGGTHSFLRGKEWRPPIFDAPSGRLTYSIGPGEFTPTEYPLRVSLELSYAIEGEHVRVGFAFHNHEPKLTAHVGFGLHPGFAAADLQAFRLEMPAGLYRRHFSPTNYLSGETEDIQFAGGDMPFSREDLPGSYILELVDVPNRLFTYTDAPGGRSVLLDLAGVPYLTLWSDGGRFLCVEPCWGLTDHENQRPFEEKEGIQTIAPGGRLEASFTMSPRLVSGQAS
jgi:galactose mutarotase-like enzyme